MKKFMINTVFIMINTMFIMINTVFIMINTVFIMIVYNMDITITKYGVHKDKDFVHHDIVYI